MPRNSKHAPNQRSKYIYDYYPHLRKHPGPNQLSPEDEGLGPESRRARLISKALRRATRRWDTYANIVKSLELSGEESSALPEWRLIAENGKLLNGLRCLPWKVEERSERLAKSGSSEGVVPEMRLHPRIPPIERTYDGFGE